MSMETKSRTLPFGGGVSRGRVERLNASTGHWEETISSEAPQPRYMGSQITASENHQWPPSRGYTGDVGGEFRSDRSKGTIPYSRFNKTWTYDTGSPTYPKRKFITNYALSCPIETVGSRPKWPTVSASSNATLNSMGATAVARCSPTASSAELSTAIGELYRDRLPALPGVHTWQSRTLAARNAGDEYLNVEFGWKPLVSDVISMRDAVANHRNILEQYNADKGKTVRRRYTFPSETTTETKVLSTNKMPNGINIDHSVPDVPPSAGGVWSKTTTTVKSRWFSGGFVYGVPQTNSVFGRARELGAEADKLFGLSLTPDVAWNLTPWSWAIDWFTNTGDVLANISDVATQGLVMRYGYMMEHTISRIQYSLTGASIKGISVSVPPASLVVETKRRVRANPFGFGVTWEGLSTSQTAILAALGISRT